ncbi:MAG: glucosaminidase domain-containing protein [Parcubacteria group bacterium]|nr:glucosaminidase domain-containing protein [Parcubacteria group bacterium]
MVLVNNLYLFIIGWSPVVAALLIGWAGIQMIIYGSNSSKIGEARNSIQKTLLWLAIIYCSFLIVNLVIHLLPVSSKLQGSWYKFTCTSHSPGLGGQGLTKVTGSRVTLSRVEQTSRGGETPPPGGGNGISHQGEYAGTLSYPKNVDPKSLNDCLDKAIRSMNSNSPLRGEWFAQEGAKHNINPAFLIAIAKQESQLGTSYDYTKADPKNGGRYNIGNIRPVGGTGFANYNSFQEGIDAKATLLADWYIYPNGKKGYSNLTTVRAVGYVYCPPADCGPSHTSKETEEWIAGVSNYMSKINSDCGGRLQTK